MEAIYPGSFDPLTSGHINIADQALNLFERLHVVIAHNPQKDHLFSGEKRREIGRAAMRHAFPDDAFEVALHDGLTSTYIKDHDIEVLVRGLRNGDDLRYEAELELFFDGTTDAQTVFLTPSSEHLKTSSTVVRRFLKAGAVDQALEYMPDVFRESDGDLLELDDSALF